MRERLTAALFFSIFLFLPAILIDAHLKEKAFGQAQLHRNYGDKWLTDLLSESLKEVQQKRLAEIALGTSRAELLFQGAKNAYFPQPVGSLSIDPFNDLRQIEKSLPERLSAGQLPYSASGVPTPLLPLSGYAAFQPMSPVPGQSQHPALIIQNLERQPTTSLQEKDNGDLRQIRVFLGSYNTLKLAYTQAAFILNGAGQTISTLAPKQIYAFSLKEGQIFVGDVPLGDRLLLVVAQPREAQENRVYLNPNESRQETYRGIVQLVATGAGIGVINHVPLEEYLYGVVGAEMPSTWHEQALMAQAIAARTYAVYHRLKRRDHLFDIGNTERWQVYRGIGRESDSSRLAVDRTRGLILVDRQGQIAFTQYAANKAIVDRAFGGKGMSQEDAHRLALAQHSYLSILSYFYPETTLAQLPPS